MSSSAIRTIPIVPSSGPAAEVRPHDARPQKRARDRLKGRQATPEALQALRALIGERPEEGHRRDLLIEHLHSINDAHHGLPEALLVALAQEMNLPVAEVYEVASFYHHFEVLRDGQIGPAVTVRVCDSLSCSLAGGGELLQRLRVRLGEGVRVQAAPCLGRCAQAPVAQVAQAAVPHANESRVEALAQRALAGEILPRERVPEFVDLAAYRAGAGGGYRLATAVAQGAHDPEVLIQTLEHAGLRGLGGAGFPAGRKWRIVRGFAAPRLMAVNIDEGEPGTFKDRHYLERDPHRFLEGVLIAAAVVGIDKVYIYLRDEYHDCRALLFGRPTLEHNFETLYWVREIVERGADWFASHGRHGRKGLRSFSVSGRVREPGVKLAPAGITLRELIDEFCGGMAEGHTLHAYLPGGASGGILPASMADIPLDFDTLQPHGCFIGSAAVMVLGQHDSVREAALNVMRFFKDESCGQCTPCRVGTDKAARLMASDTWDQDTLRDLADVMGDASICGLGQAAPNPIRSVLKHFAHEVGGAA